MGKSLVITTAFAYAPDDLRPLACSLQRNSPDTDLLIQTSSKDLKQLIGLQGEFSNIRFCTIPNAPIIIKGRLALARKAVSHSLKNLRKAQQKLTNRKTVTIEQKKLWEISTLQCHFLIRRFFWARTSLLEANNANYEHVMLCDSRDVIIQKDPFLESFQHISTGAEVNTIGDCHMNKKWMLKAYGKITLQSIQNNRILCAGVTLGERAQILKYLNLICGDAVAVMQEKHTGFLSNLDQAIHNKILRSPGLLDFTESRHDGFIATIGCTDSDSISIASSSGKNIIVNSHIPAIIHQYDRIPWLAAHIKKEYGERRD